MSEQYRSYYFQLNIDQDELMRLYRGSVHRLRVRTIEGIVLDLDANHLRRFTSHRGIQGYFRLITTLSNRFVGLERVN